MNSVRVKRRPTLQLIFPLLVVLSLILAACGTPAATTPSASAPASAEPSAAASPAASEAASPAASEAASPAASEAASPSGAAAPAGNGIMTVSVQQQPTWVRNFNPFSNAFLFPTVHGVYEPLMIYNVVKGELTPWLATDYKWSEDNKTLTFTLRENVKWSDGQPFTANDVAFTFNLLQKTSGLIGSGAVAMNGDTAYVESVAAPDEKTVVFTFKQVFTPGLYDIANQDIVAEHIWKDVPDATKFTNDNPVGTGPFTEVTVFQNQIYQIEKNPNYWQEGKPYIQGFRAPAYPGNDQANLATINGENDLAANFIPDIEKTYVSKSAETNGYWFPSVGATVMLYTNTTKAPFDNADVRKAISMAINREQIVKVAMYDYTKPADPTGLSDAYPNFKLQNAASIADWTNLNVEKANQMLDAAGLTKGANGIRNKPDGTPMTYEINVVSGWSDWVSAVQIIAQNLKDVGIEATVKTYDFSAWIDRVQKGDFDMSIGWSTGGATPFNYYRGQMSASTKKPIGEIGGENWHRFSSTKADELLTQFAGTADPAQQKAVAE
ncbi:MAG: ABC transporter substrate-binding protein, partial [Chloroflexi bacterium]|nr:ABC transporter substrate-binding protein [Chloroflexota bacterium]